MNVVAYMGGAADRKVVESYELYYRDEVTGAHTGKPSTRTHKFDVMLTSFELLRDSPSLFNAFHWDIVIVDEAHRLKSLTSSTRYVVNPWLPFHVNLGYLGNLTVSST